MNTYLNQNKYWYIVFVYVISANPSNVSRKKET